MGTSYAASSSDQIAGLEKDKREGIESQETTNEPETQSADNTTETETETEIEPPEKLLSFNKEKIIENEPSFSVVEDDEDWRKVGQHIPEKESVIVKEEPDIKFAANANPVVSPLKEGTEWKDLKQPDQPTQEKVKADYKPMLDEIEKQKQKPIDYNSIDADMRMRAKGLQPDENSVAKERAAALQEKRDFNWDNVEMKEVQPDKKAQDKVYVYEDQNGNKWTEEDVQKAVNNEIAYLDKMDQEIAKNVNVTEQDITSIDKDMFLRSEGLQPDENSVAKERAAALQEKRDFNWDNVEMKQVPVDKEAVLYMYLDKGVVNDNLLKIFDENIPLRDRVIKLQNEGKTVQQIFNDKRVRNALNLVTNEKLAGLALDALSVVASAGINAFIQKSIANQAAQSGRRLGGYTAAVNKAKNAEQAASRAERVVRQRHALNYAKEAGNAVRTAATGATGAITGAAGLASSGIAGTNKDALQTKTPSIYDPNVNVKPDTSNIDLPQVEGLQTTVKPDIGTINLSLNLDSSWNDLKQALGGQVTKENIKDKTDYLRDLLDNGYIETMAKAKGLQPNQIDAVYKELYNAVTQLQTITDSYTGDYEQAAKQILDNPKEYGIEDRISARNVLDGNAYNGKQDSVFTAGKTLDYIKSKLENVRVENAFRNRKVDPDTWHNVISEMSEDVRKNVLSTTSDGRFLGKDTSNVLSNGLSKAKNSFIEAKNEFVSKVKEITGLDKVFNKLSNTKAGQMYSKAKSVVGTILSNIVNPLEGIGNLIKHGIELPVQVFGDSLIQAGYKTAGNWVNKINDKIGVARAGLTGDADVNNMDQLEAALATKQGRAVISGLSKIIEGAMSFTGTTGLSASQIVRGVSELMIGLDPNTDVKRINNAADQALDALGITEDSTVMPDVKDNDVDTTEDDIVKKKKKTSTSDIENDEGITANAAGFNSGLGADTIKYLYENLFRQNKQTENS